MEFFRKCFGISGESFAMFWRKTKFKIQFFWRWRTPLGPSGPKTCLFSGFEAYGFLPGGILGGSEIGRTRAHSGTKIYKCLAGGAIFLYDNPCTRVCLRKQPREKLFWHNKTKQMAPPSIDVRTPKTPAKNVARRIH